MRVGVVVPHIFMQPEILPEVIFSPGVLALQLVEELATRPGVDVTLYSPGKVSAVVTNRTADLSGFEGELAARGYGYLELLKRNPLTFVSLARQAQARLVAQAFGDANRGKLDLVHIYTNEEELGVIFAEFCRKPVVFTHHDPFNFTSKYRSVLPQYKHLNWLSISLAQRKAMPPETNWVGNTYHGLDRDAYTPNYSPSGNYIAYLGRIIKPKGLHLAIKAAKRSGLKLKIAGKHYAGQGKDEYWNKLIAPELGSELIEYVGFIKETNAKSEFLGNTAALVVPSTWEEPFGMVSIEALACATPVIGFDRGATPEIITNGKSGRIIKYNETDEEKNIAALAEAFLRFAEIDRRTCRREFEARFTLKHMVDEHLNIYRKLV